MPIQGNLLNDQQMRSYIRDGYITVKADYPGEFHSSIYGQLETVLQTEWNPGNNILPRVPDLQDVLDHPNVIGALTSIMGQNYFLHPHRHCHFNPPGSEGQRLHKDGYTKRRHRTRWAMGMYYPQDVTLDMGPTGVAPGTYYNNVAPESEEELAVVGDAGTFTIVHYDIFHRGTPNLSEKNRYMVKFLFVRMEEPEIPSWASSNTTWEHVDDIRDGMWMTMWDWHNGANTESGKLFESDFKSRDLLKTIEGNSEPEALQAAYIMRNLGESVVPALIDIVRSGADRLSNELTQFEGVSLGSQNATYALAAIGSAAVTALSDLLTDSNPIVRAMSAATIGEMGREGREGIPALKLSLSDESSLVRQEATEALGIVDNDGEAVTALINSLQDEEDAVRKAAALGLARIGPKAEEAIPELIKSLRDTDKLVRSKAIHALDRIGTSEAREALLRFLLTARWDNLSGKKG